MPRSNKKPKCIRNYLAGQNLVQRWLLCQQIGKVYYQSSLSAKEIEDLYWYLQRSDIIPKDISIIDLK